MQGHERTTNVEPFTCAPVRKRGYPSHRASQPPLHEVEATKLQCLPNRASFQRLPNLLLCNATSLMLEGDCIAGVILFWEKADYSKSR